MAYKFIPDGTRASLSGWRSANGGIRWNCRQRVLEAGGEAMRRNADGGPIRPIVRLRPDNLNVLEEDRELRCSERTEKHGRVRVFRVGGVLDEVRRVCGFVGLV